MTLIGPLPTPVDSPTYPTPWSLDTDGDLLDANRKSIKDRYGHGVEFPALLAQAIIEAVNAHYGAAPAAPMYSYELRDLVDRDGDEWFEVVRGEVIMATAREYAEEIANKGGRRGRAIEGFAYAPLRDAATREIIPEHR